MGNIDNAGGGYEWLRECQPRAGEEGRDCGARPGAPASVFFRRFAKQAILGIE